MCEEGVGVGVCGRCGRCEVEMCKEGVGVCGRCEVELCKEGVRRVWDVWRA